MYITVNYPTIEQRVGESVHLLAAATPKFRAYLEQYLSVTPMSEVSSNGFSQFLLSNEAFCNKHTLLDAVQALYTVCSEYTIYTPSTVADKKIHTSIFRVGNFGIFNHLN